MAFQFVRPSQTAERLMCKTPWMQRLMLAYYRPIVEKEVGLSRASRLDAILCVGGGYFPCTAILFHLLTGASVAVVDNDKNAVFCARRLVRQMGLHHHVLVRHSDGAEVCAKAYDIIHIAMQISPKEKVFHQLHDSAHKQTKILVRIPKAHLERGYQPFKTACQQRDSIRQPAFSNIHATGLYVR
ncbi:hypothetical protein RFF05_13650 [Bengtsoniella intestinalis]|uniref:hypothetical protein n=1 Tax=Bengtsoniella intestinalis TaxID=3073143 RepID=UPI00391F033B